MKVRVERSALVDVLGWVARAIPKGPSVPVLAGIRIVASEGVVRLSAFDYENQHTAALEATVLDEGECVVPGLFLRDAIAGGRGAESDLVLNGSELEVTSGRSTYRVRTFATKDAPDLPTFPKVHGVINADTLRDAVALIAPAISDDPLFSLTQGVRIEGVSDRLSLVATDRFRFHAIDVPWSGESFEVTVPGRSLVDALKGMVDDVEVGVSDGLLGLSDGRSQWTTRRFTHPYVTWRAAIDAAKKRCVESAKVDRDDLLRAVKQVGSVMETGRSVVVDCSDGEVAVRTPEQDSGEGLETLDCEATADLAMAPNPRFLTDALTACNGPVEIRYGGAYERGGPFVVADTSRPELTLIIQSKSMPGGTS